MSQLRKIMLLGRVGVGKTSIANRLAFDRFESSYKPTLGVDLYTASLDVDGTPHRLVLWDTDGDLQEHLVASTYCRGASAACVVGDASRPDTVEGAARIGAAFAEQHPGRPVKLLANKLDLAAPEEGAADFAVSALDGRGLRDALRTVARECWELSL